MRIFLNSTVSVVSLVGLALAAASCDELLERPLCHDVLCFNQTELIIERGDAVWADGDYTLDIRLGADQHRCTFTLPIPGKLPHELQLRGEPVACTPDVPETPIDPAVALFPTPNPSRECPEPDGGPPLGFCPPLAGRYRLEVHTTAAPEELELRLALGDTVLLEQTEAIEYAESYPNGPDCGGPCYSADRRYHIAEP